MVSIWAGLIEKDRWKEDHCQIKFRSDVQFLAAGIMANQVTPASSK
jgi:hypothetical protein